MYHNQDNGNKYLYFPFNLPVCTYFKPVIPKISLAC